MNISINLAQQEPASKFTNARQTSFNELNMSMLFFFQHDEKQPLWQMMVTPSPAHSTQYLATLWFNIDVVTMH